MPKICHFLFLLALSTGLLACRHTPQGAAQKAALRAAAKTDTANITNPELKALAEKLDGLLTRYYALSPFNNIEIDSVRLPKAVIDTLLQENTSEEFGKISGLTLIGYYQGEISNVVDSILKHPAVGRYPLQALLPGAITSDDGRLITFSIDQQTGGTYHSMFTWTQYRAPNGKIFNYYADDGSEDKTDGLFNGDGYYQIITLKSKHGVKYLMLGSVVGCSTCIGNYADLFSYKNGKLESDFSCNISYRAYSNLEQGITYDAKTRLLLVEYETSDQSADCQCESESDEEQATATNTETAVTNTAVSTHPDEDESKKYGKECRCEYIYNGETFVLKPVKKVRGKR